MTQSSKGMGPDNGDKMYAKLGGKFTGLCAWEPEKSGQEINHINRIVDLRWVFPDAVSAKAYLKDQLGAMAEGQDPVKSPPKVGEECWVFGGVFDLKISDPLRTIFLPSGKTTWS